MLGHCKRVGFLVSVAAQAATPNDLVTLVVVRRLSIVSALVASATVVAGLTAFSLDPAEFSLSSVALITVGFLMSTIVLVAGFLLVRAPWGRWGLAGAAAAAMLLASTSSSWLVYVVYGLGAASIIGLGGPWVKFWVRQHPVPNAVNPTAVALSSFAPVAPLLIGLAAFDTSHWSHWLAASVGTGSSFMYSRGAPGALWLMRLAIPVTSAIAIWKSPMPPAVILVVAALAVSVLAWSPPAAKISSVPAPLLPPPRTPRKKQPDAP